MGYSDDYDPENDDRWDDPDDWPYDEIDRIIINIDSDSVDVSVEIDGEIFDVLSLDHESAQSVIWDEIYWEADSWGIDIDKEVDYGED